MSGKKKVAKKTRISKQRYFGLVKIKRGEKLCWVSRQDKNGWSMGLGLGSRTIWLTGIRLADVKEVDRVRECSAVFVHMKNSEEMPKRGIVVKGK